MLAKARASGALALLGVDRHPDSGKAMVRAMAVLSTDEACGHEWELNVFAPRKTGEGWSRSRALMSDC